MTIQVGSTYRLNRTLYFENAPPISEGTLGRVIGKAVYTDTTPHEEVATLEFDNNTRLITLFDDYLREVLEPVE